MKHDANVSFNAAAEQVKFFFLIHCVKILHVRSQDNILLYLFRNTFDNSWIMYTGIEAMWLGKHFIASKKTDNGWIKTKQ